VQTEGEAVVGQDRALALGLVAFGIPGLREVVLVALVALALYGRSGTRLLMATRYGRSLHPWLRLAGLAPRPQARPSPATRTAAATGTGTRRQHGRWFWALVLTASAAVAAWVATRIVIQSGSGSH
jgi:hypothetical protein